MGILLEPADFVRALPLPAGFSVCELGDQYITHTTPHYLARDFYRALGCKRYVSIDGNGRGTITVDLNLPPKKWGWKYKAFDLTTDFGTGEHVFNQAQVWRTLHDLTKAGGFIAFDRPMQGYDVHCFYLVNECLFRDLAAANHYEIVALEMADTKRGRLCRGVFHKPQTSSKFVIPQQGRYQKALQI